MMLCTHCGLRQEQNNYAKIWTPDGCSYWVNRCASTSNQTAAKQPERKPRVVFEQPITKAQQAAVDALAVVGCVIMEKRPNYVEGRRPNYLGLFVGSGGETVKVWLEALEPQKTNVKIKTEKSFVGIAGQKDWYEQVLAEMTKALSK